MTLFWHDHFATSQRKVRLAALMYRQNATLRANAVGNFGVLLHVVARDPAMMIWLDTVQNRRGHPNENFAREVMELFTLGEGHYGEQDVQEAARAFTGWSIDRASGAFVFRPRLHDNGMKTVFGHTGNFDGDGVLDVILRGREPRSSSPRRCGGNSSRPIPIRKPSRASPRAFARRATTSRSRCATCSTATRCTRPRRAACR